jgi:hypothetical protein
VRGQNQSARRRGARGTRAADGNGRRCGPGAAAATHHLFFRVYRWRPAAAGLKHRGKFQERREKLLSEAEGVDGSRTRPSRPGGTRFHPSANVTFDSN